VLTFDLPAESLRVRFDSQGYRLVLSNLVSNAVKYTPSGSVHVRLSMDETHAALEVADTGLGIPDADVPKLFTEFFRASNAKANAIEGSGVGLSGAKALVERFGGEFLLQTKENKGSAFTVRLPLARDESAAG
jgi:two-component system phosphate regulon sensor histidine kinase PhoR